MTVEKPGMKPAREPGWYWVLGGDDQWFPLEYTGTGWVCNDEDDNVPDAGFLEIDERRITRPEAQRRAAGGGPAVQTQAEDVKVRGDKDEPRNQHVSRITRPPAPAEVAGAVRWATSRAKALQASLDSGLIKQFPDLGSAPRQEAAHLRTLAAAAAAAAAERAPTYAEGAEAMREAAAKVCEDALWFHGPGTGEVPSVMQTLAACQKAIRALPLPEPKP